MLGAQRVQGGAVAVGLEPGGGDGVVHMYIYEPQSGHGEFIF